jgi:hypothetical protein
VIDPALSPPSILTLSPSLTREDAPIEPLPTNATRPDQAPVGDTLPID